MWKRCDMLLLFLPIMMQFIHLINYHVSQIVNIPSALSLLGMVTHQTAACARAIKRMG